MGTDACRYDASKRLRSSTPRQPGVTTPPSPSPSAPPSATLRFSQVNWAEMSGGPVGHVCGLRAAPSRCDAFHFQNCALAACFAETEDHDSAVRIFLLAVSPPVQTHILHYDHGGHFEKRPPSKGNTRSRSHDALRLDTEHIHLNSQFQRENWLAVTTNMVAILKNVPTILKSNFSWNIRFSAFTTHFATTSTEIDLPRTVCDKHEEAALCFAKQFTLRLFRE